jgi:Leucine-rich repeat (LRR) protein
MLEKIKQLIHNSSPENINLGLLLDESQNQGRYTKELQNRYANVLKKERLSLFDLLTARRLRLSNSGYKKLNLQGLCNLEVLYCNKNELTELNVQGLCKLKTLFCDNNELTELNVKGLSKLEWLDCE